MRNISIDISDPPFSYNGFRVLRCKLRIWKPVKRVQTSGHVHRKCLQFRFLAEEKRNASTYNKAQSSKPNIIPLLEGMSHVLAVISSTTNNFPVVF